MDVFDKILKEHSWKFKKGYPDIKDIEDKTLLEKIVNEYLTEAEADTGETEVEDEVDVNVDVEA